MIILVKGADIKQKRLENVIYRIVLSIFLFH